MQHWQAWAPILARTAATGLALLGLAGIGWAAKGSGEFAALSTAPLAFGLAQMAGSGVGVPAVHPPGVPAPGSSSSVPCAPTSAAPGAPPPTAGPERPSQMAAGTSDAGLTADGRVILNRASATELQRLPAVGAKRAAAIVELRQRLGRFRRASDLLRIRGIGPRTLERMLPLIVLDPG